MSLCASSVLFRTSTPPQHRFYLKRPFQTDLLLCREALCYLPFPMSDLKANLKQHLAAVKAAKAKNEDALERDRKLVAESRTQSNKLLNGAVKEALSDARNELVEYGFECDLKESTMDSPAVEFSLVVGKRAQDRFSKGGSELRFTEHLGRIRVSASTMNQPNAKAERNLERDFYPDQLDKGIIDQYVLGFVTAAIPAPN